MSTSQSRGKLTKLLITGLFCLQIAVTGALVMLDAPSASAVEDMECQYYWQQEYRATIINGEYQCGSGFQDCTQCETQDGDTCAEDGMDFCNPDGFLEKTMSP